MGYAKPCKTEQTGSRHPSARDRRATRKLESRRVRRANDKASARETAKETGR